MRPITLTLQVVLATTSAAIARTFTPPRHLASIQHETSWRRLGTACATSGQRTAPAPADRVEGGHRYPRPRPSLRAFGFPCSDTRGDRRQAPLAASSWPQCRGLYCLQRGDEGGRPSRAPAGSAYSTGVDHSASSGMPAAAFLCGPGGSDNESSSSSGVGQQLPGSEVDEVLTQESVDLGAGLHPAAPGDDELNVSQRNAVFAEIGAVRVVAGPGSGKTRVLIRRIAHLVCNVGAPAWSILAVTFTKKAAEEMRDRLRKTLGEDVSNQVALGTFHSICARLLRRHGDALPAIVPGLDGRFSIFDTEDSRRLLTEIIQENRLDTMEVKPAMIRSSISKLKSQGLGPEDMRVKSKGRVGRAEKYAKTVAQIYKTYQTRLVNSNAVDFDDIILVALRLLRHDAKVFRAVGRQYRHILVDEWQDTNGPQYDLVLEIVRAGREAQLARDKTQRAAQFARALQDGRAPPPGPEPAPPPPSIFVVGDTDQCIYKFRGADYTNVARFVEDFEGCRTVLLQENYRSTANIARAATAVIGQVSSRAGQATVATTAVQGDGLPIGIMVCSDAAGEAEAVAHHVELYWTSGRVPPSEMAVMYRTNAQSRSFEEAFLRKALPFVVVGAQRFYGRREVKDCLVYLRLAANPRDAVAMQRAINTPTRGIGPKTVEALETLATSARRNIPGLEGITVPESLMSLLDPTDLDELERVLGDATAAAAAAVAAAVASTGGLPPASLREGTLGGGFGAWPGEEKAEYAAAMAAGVGEDGGWADFSVQRVRLLRDAMTSLSSSKKKTTKKRKQKKKDGDDEEEEAEEEEGGAVGAMIEGPTKGQANKLGVFARLLCRLRVASATLSVPELLTVLLHETDMHKHVTETLSTTGPDEGEDRWQNVMELERAASNPKFSGVAAEGALLSFLNEVSLVGGDDPGQERKQREEQEAAEAAGGRDAKTGLPAKPPMIQLMTAHASKGLEFDTVFVTGCEEGTFPFKDTTEDVMDEERRLMYVSMTRAKARLFLSWRKQRMVFGKLGGGKIVNSHRSRFLDDIPANIVRTIDKTSGGGSGSGSQKARKHAYGSGGGSGRPENRQRGGGYVGGGQGGSSAQRGAPTYGRAGGNGAGRTASKRGRGGAAAPEPEGDPTLDFLTELSNSASREAQARRNDAGGTVGGYGSGYPSGASGGKRYGASNRAKGGRGAGHGGRGGDDGGGRGGRSYESRSSSYARIFMEKRDKAEKARYPVPALRDRGNRMARDAGEGLDTSWAKKLASARPEASEFPPGVVVGAQVSHPVHGPGQVIELVEGSETVNVRFVSKGQPFVIRTLGRKLKLLG